MPYGTDEAFLVPEVSALLRLGHEVLIVPRSPAGAVLHAAHLVPCTRAESLLSRRVVMEATRKLLRSPRSVLAAAGSLRASRSPWVLMKNLSVLPKALWLAETAKNWRADHIHCHWAGTTATVAFLASQVSGIPWSFTAHRWDIVENNLLAVKAAHATFARFIAKDGLRMATERGVPRGASTQVVHMGVSIPAIVPGDAGGPLVVMCAARLSEVKGHRILLEAWRSVLEELPDSELWLAGDGELRHAITALITQAGLQHSVKLLGAVPHAELLRMYERKRVSAVVLASLDLGGECHEGIPVSLIEAMSYGLPVIATATGGIGELIEPGTGFLVPPGDCTALSKAILRVARDRAVAHSLGVAARHHVEMSFNVTQIASELESAFRSSAARQADIPVGAA